MENIGLIELPVDFEYLHWEDPNDRLHHNEVYPHKHFKTKAFLISSLRYVYETMSNEYIKDSNIESDSPYYDEWVEHVHNNWYSESLLDYDEFMENLNGKV